MTCGTPICRIGAPWCCRQDRPLCKSLRSAAAPGLSALPAFSRWEWTPGEAPGFGSSEPEQAQAGLGEIIDRAFVHSFGMALMEPK